MTTQEFLKLTPQQKEKGVFIQGDESNGIFCAWYPNGQLYEKYTYVNGKLDGECILYTSNGLIDMHSIYTKGKFGYEIY